MVKIPTLEEFYRFDGAHCKNLWAEVGPDYVCPSCWRTKYQIYRWTMRFPDRRDRFEGWIAVLHRHHDHGGDVLPYGGGGSVRFPATVICDQCNSADGSAKRSLQLPRRFSFAPWEIAQFITATPHGKHKCDFDIARRLYMATLPVGTTFLPRVPD